MRALFLALFRPAGEATAPEGVYVGGVALLTTQVIAVGVTIAYVGCASWLLLTLTRWLVGLRVSGEDEREGLDIALHGEQVF